MTGHDLLIELGDRGVRFRLEGDDLVADAPTGVITPEIRSALAANKVAVRTFLDGAHMEGSRREDNFRIRSTHADRPGEHPLDDVIAADIAGKYSSEEIQQRIARCEARAACPGARPSDIEAVHDWRCIWAVKLGSVAQHSNGVGALLTE